MEAQHILSIDLLPLPGKVYYNSSRPWQEEIIYFLLIDRFHDGKERIVGGNDGVNHGYGSVEELGSFCGGKINGVRKNLDYIKNLGCTSIWLSPFLKNNPNSYHGYAIENFLEIDPRFGTKEELVLLIEEAHQRDVKIFFDCVINHTGDNWSYKEAEECWYDNKKNYHFGNWRRPDIPIPVELGDQKYYTKKGMIRNWDKYPESTEGDFFSLKKLNYSETEDGLALQEIVFKIYAYWLKETDCDGFRMDAAKHLGELPLARFSSRIKSYAASLGKTHFFVFAEVAGDDLLLQKFLKQVDSKLEGITFDPVDSLLDFSLHFKLPKFLKGEVTGNVIFDRYDSIKKNILHSKISPIHLITFLDNHDQIEKPIKERIAYQLGEKKLLNALQLLFTLPGVPCLYYGTEQALQGHGPTDHSIRELMFDPHSDRCIHDQNSIIFKEIQRLSELRKEYESLIYGEVARAHVSSGMGGSGSGSVIAYSREWNEEELIILCNTSENETIVVSVKKDKMKNQSGQDEKLRIVYGGEEVLMTSVSMKNYQLYQLKIPPSKFLILK